MITVNENGAVNVSGRTYDIAYQLCEIIDAVITHVEETYKSRRKTLCWCMDMVRRMWKARERCKDEEGIASKAAGACPPDDRDGAGNAEESAAADA